MRSKSGFLCSIRDKTLLSQAIEIARIGLARICTYAHGGMAVLDDDV